MYNTSKITQLKTIRIKNECADFYKERPLNRYVEDMQRYIESGDIEETGEGIKVLHTKGLSEACKPRHVDPQVLIDKLTDGLINTMGKRNRSKLGLKNEKKA